MSTIVRLAGTEQMRALADPRRLAILRHLMGTPATLTQLGGMFGRHPAWIRHHVLQLQAAGLIEPAPPPPDSAHGEKYYRATADLFRLDMFITKSANTPSVVIAGSDDEALQLLATTAGPPGMPGVVVLSLGSLEGLLTLRRGHCHAAGCHLYDAETGDFNVPYVRRLFPGTAVTLMTLYHREQGLIVAAGNPLGLGGIADVAARGARVVNRNVGSGTRVWFDRLVAEAGVDSASLAGYGDEPVNTHAEAAAVVAEGRADAAPGLRAAAVGAQLDFVPLFRERFDLAMYADEADGPVLGPLRAYLCSAHFGRRVEALGGYDLAECGRTVTIQG